MNTPVSQTSFLTDSAPAAKTAIRPITRRTIVTPKAFMKIHEKNQPDCLQIAPVAENNFIPGQIGSPTLTKKILFELPEGAIVVSNLFYMRDGRKFPFFVARLETGFDRSKIWRQAIDANVHQRQCHVYWTAEDVLRKHGFDLNVWIGKNWV